MLDRLIAGGGDAVDSQSGFRAYSRKAFEQINASELGMGVDSEILMQAKEARLRIVQVPVTMEYKNLQTSTHNPIYHWFDVTFSVVKFISIRHPLSFYGGFAAILFATALIFGFETLDYYAKCVSLNSHRDSCISIILHGRDSLHAHNRHERQALSLASRADSYTRSVCSATMDQ
jgi:hypothetical protein